MSTPDLPPQQPQQPQYQSAPGAPLYQTGQQRYNTMAIVGFILSFFISVVGVILGFVALSQIKKTGEQGRGFAIAAIIIGFAEIVLGIIISIIFISIAASVGYHYSNS